MFSSEILFLGFTNQLICYTRVHDKNIALGPGYGNFDRKLSSHMIHW